MISSISQPIIEDPFEVLKQIQNSDRESRVETIYSECYPILQLDTYLELEKKHENSHLSNNNNESELQDLLEECEHIHNKAIFDATNEVLNMMRPYGIYGQPMPWINTLRILVAEILYTIDIIKRVKEKEIGREHV